MSRGPRKVIWNRVVLYFWIWASCVGFVHSLRGHLRVQKHHRVTIFWPNASGRHYAKRSIQSPPKESIHLRQSQVLKIKGARGKVGGVPHPLVPLGFEYSARQKCILSFGGDCNILSRCWYDTHYLDFWKKSCEYFFPFFILFYFLKSWCHSKRRMGSATHAHSSFGMITTQDIGTKAWKWHFGDHFVQNYAWNYYVRNDLRSTITSKVILRRLLRT